MYNNFSLPELTEQLKQLNYSLTNNEEFAMKPWQKAVAGAAMGAAAFLGGIKTKSLLDANKPIPIEKIIKNNNLHIREINLEAVGLPDLKNYINGKYRFEPIKKTVNKGGVYRPGYILIAKNYRTDQIIGRISEDEMNKFKEAAEIYSELLDKKDSISKEKAYKIILKISRILNPISTSLGKPISAISRLTETTPTLSEIVYDKDFNYTDEYQFLDDEEYNPDEDKTMQEDKSITQDKTMTKDKTLTQNKKLTSDKRLTEDKRLFDDLDEYKRRR